MVGGCRNLISNRHDLLLTTRITGISLHLTFQSMALCQPADRNELAQKDDNVVSIKWPCGGCSSFWSTTLNSTPRGHSCDIVDIYVGGEFSPYHPLPLLLMIAWGSAAHQGLVILSGAVDVNFHSLARLIE